MDGESNAPINFPTITSPPSVQAADKAIRTLQSLIGKGGISPQGMKFIELATDPFHDNPVQGYEGIPDYETGKSVISSVVQETEIAKPSTLGPGLWKCRITTYPITGSLGTHNAKCVQNVAYDTQGAFPLVDAGRMQAISIDYAQDGDDFPAFPTQAGTSPSGISIPAPLTEGPFKVSGLGVEIVNTTAELTKQGLCTCARMSQPASQPSTYQVSVTTNSSAFSFASLLPILAPPKNLSEMMLLPETTQWHAKEGAYAVVNLKGIGTRASACQPTYPILYRETLKTGVDLTQRDVRIPIPSLVTVGTMAVQAVIFENNPGISPADASVIMFTGLSDTTTLTVRGRWIIERFPTQYQDQIIYNATPTASFDPLALEVYSRVMNQLPPGVMFKENPAGEWFRRVITKVAQVASSILGSIPHPVAQAAGAGAAALSKALENTEEKQKRKRKKAKKQNKAIVAPPSNQVPNPPVVVANRAMRRAMTAQIKGARPHT
jgi:hypothetical protein